MTSKTTSNRARGLIVATVIAVAAGAGAAAWAQTAPVENAGVTVPANVLSVGEIESRLAAQGIKVKEIEVRDLLAEVEGWDSQGREIELTIDRRNGETLSREFDR